MQMVGYKRNFHFVFVDTSYRMYNANDTMSILLKHRFTCEGED